MDAFEFLRVCRRPGFRLESNGFSKMDLTTAFALAGLAAVSTLPQDAPGEPPNVVIIFTDDQGTLDANCFGSADLATPSIDKLAERGVRFTQAYAHTVCCPARAMLMTGRYPQRSDVNSWMQGRMHGTKGRNMLASEVTLAEVLQAAGYRTALFGKWHLGAHRDHGPTSQGFGEFFGIRNGFIDNVVHYQLHGTGYHDLYEGTTEVFHRGEYFPDLIGDRALSFMERNQDRPFFLYYALNIPHYPEQSLARYEQLYQELSDPRRSYAAMISTTDNYIGRLLTQLETLDLTDNTIIVFMSDNGHSEEDYQIPVDGHLSGYPRGHNYGAHGGGGNTGHWIGCKGSFLEGGIRVPAILSYPNRLPRGVVRDQAVTAMDWFPTILELCRIDPPEDIPLDGHSVIPLVEDDSAPSAYGVMYWQWQKGWMIRESNWKLIVNNSRGLGQKALNKIYLANLDDEFPETINHAEEHPDIVQRLTQLHDQWLEEVTPEVSLGSAESPP